MAYITEGIATCVISVTLYFTISDFPEDATWLTSEEKEFVKARLFEDVGDSRKDHPLNIRSILTVFKDCKQSHWEFAESTGRQTG